MDGVNELVKSEIWAGYDALAFSKNRNDGHQSWCVSDGTPGQHDVGLTSSKTSSVPEWECRIELGKTSHSNGALLVSFHRTDAYTFYIWVMKLWEKLQSQFYDAVHKLTDMVNLKSHKNASKGQLQEVVIMHFCPWQEQWLQWSGIEGAL